MLCLSITFSGGGKHDGILLALSKKQMRIALEGCTDVVELREVEGQWILNDGTLVELDGLFSDSNSDVALFSELYPRAAAMGHWGGAAVDLSWSQYRPLSATSLH